MDAHKMINNMQAIVLRLRMAETLCASPRVIDEIRAALAIALDVGEECGKQLTKEK